MSRFFFFFFYVFVENRDKTLFGVKVRALDPLSECNNSQSVFKWIDEAVVPALQEGMLSSVCLVVSENKSKDAGVYEKYHFVIENDQLSKDDEDFSFGGRKKKLDEKFLRFFFFFFFKFFFFFSFFQNNE